MPQKQPTSFGPSGKFGFPKSSLMDRKISIGRTLSSSGYQGSKQKKKSPAKYVKPQLILRYWNCQL
jgi:hypothetical protein